MHNVAVLDQKWWLGAFWLSGNKLLGACRGPVRVEGGLASAERLASAKKAL